MATSYIYCITNVVNGKKYIGVTTRNPHQRWLEHVSRSRYDKKYSSAIHSALRKYGVANFVFEVLFESWDKEYCVSFVEPELIKEFNTYNNGYNLTLGGDFKIMNPVVKEKISKAKVGHSVSKETREKLRKFNNKEYLVIYPNGGMECISNLKEFTKKNNISYTYALKLIKNRHTQSYGCKGLKIMKKDTVNTVQGG